MDRKKALEIIGLREDERSLEVIRERYIRLSRRYSSPNFQDKLLDIRTAYDYLTAQRPDLEDILKNSNLTISDLGLSVSIPNLWPSSDRDFFLRRFLRLRHNSGEATDELLGKLMNGQKDIIPLEQLQRIMLGKG